MIIKIWNGLDTESAEAYAVEWFGPLSFLKYAFDVGSVSTFLESRTPTISHYFGNIHCLKEQPERKTASSHVRDLVSNTSTHAHWLQYRNSDFRLTLNKKTYVLKFSIVSTRRCCDENAFQTMELLWAIAFFIKKGQGGGGRSGTLIVEPLSVRVNWPKSC